MPVRAICTDSGLSGTYAAVYYQDLLFCFIVVSLMYGFVLLLVATDELTGGDLDAWTEARQ